MQVSKIGGTLVKKKIGGEDITIGHSIRVKCVKNKTAAPFRKAEFPILYDGTPSNIVKEMVELAIKNEVIPRYKADGTLDPKGRQFKLEATYTDEDGNEQIETLIAKSKAEIAPELEKLPHVQEKILEYLKNPEKAPALYETDGEEEDEDDDFGFDESGSPAEEIESWENLD